MEMVRGYGHLYGYPHSEAIYLDIHTDMRADVRFELSVLRRVRPGQGSRSHAFERLFSRALTLNKIVSWSFCNYLP